MTGPRRRSTWLVPLLGFRALPGRGLPLEDGGSLEAGGGASLTLLPQNAGDESPACLDGSPYGVYFKPSASNSTRWTIEIQGGGWCYDERSCFARSKGFLGSSKKFGKSSGCQCMNADDDGKMADCNCLFLPYCDGASFSGFRRSRWPVPDAPSDTVFFRGIKNLDAAVGWALAHGLDAATDFVLTGGSAGGLSTFLHADRVAMRVARDAPRCRSIKAAPVVGYFLDHDNFVHDSHNYTAQMKYLFSMQNLTFGTDGALAPACRDKFPGSPHYCFMSPHMQQFIATPFFMFNSKYDAWQLSNELQVPWKTGGHYDDVISYGQDFLRQLQPVLSEDRNGAFITSCVCHGCDWSRLSLNNKTGWQYYADWFHGKTAENSSFHIDPKGPNGEDPRVPGRWCFPVPKVSVPLMPSEQTYELVV